MTFSRRKILKGGLALSASAAALPAALGSALAAESPVQTPLISSGYPFEHLNPLLSGKVQVDGFATEFRAGKISDINTNLFSGPQDFDYTEIGLIPWILAYANDDFQDYWLIPVFPLRMFRHRSIFVRSDTDIEKPEQLKGRRVGSPSYSSTSLTWIRGIMQDEYGVSPLDVEWVISADDSSAGVGGKRSAQENFYPDGLNIRSGPAGKDESDLLLEGEVDALYHAAEPRAWVEGDPRIRRLFEDSRTVERAYFSKTGIHPIMHSVAVRKALVSEHPELPKALFEAYSAAKSLAYADMSQRWAMRTLPWFAAELESTQALMGDNFHTYGLEANRNTLDALFRYAHEQGLAQRRVSVEEMFEPSTLTLTEG